MMNLQQQLRLGLKLTPQQVQYLKLLQLPNLSLEQRIKLELELNPMLELQEDEELSIEQEESIEDPEERLEEIQNAESSLEEDKYSIDDYMADEIAGYKSPEATKNNDEDDGYESPIQATIPLSEKLLTQLRLSETDDETILIAEEILGNVDEDGYLRRDINLIVQDINLSYGLTISLEKAEKTLQKILLLDPAGIAARNLQECLTAQLHAGTYQSQLKEIAIKILNQHFDNFKLKKYDILEKDLNIDRDTLKKVIELIQHLNPKPGDGQFSAQENYITPDFIVEKDKDDFIVTLNDKNIPSLRISNAYKQLIAPKGKKVSAETKDFVKKKFESAKWFIASIHQRRETLMKVMKTIVEKQKDWFTDGETLKPMIYKNISEIVGVDISTISRVVNSKYVQTEFGVYPLKYFFTSSLESETGENISNQVVKQRVKEIIETENPQEPINDDAISDILNKEGIKIARRTVAKYREQLGLPISRLRKKI